MLSFRLISHTLGPFVWSRRGEKTSTPCSIPKSWWDWQSHWFFSFCFRVTLLDTCCAWQHCADTRQPDTRVKHYHRSTSQLRFDSSFGHMATHKIWIDLRDREEECVPRVSSPIGLAIFIIPNESHSSQSNNKIVKNAKWKSFIISSNCPRSPGYNRVRRYPRVILYKTNRCFIDQFQHIE